ncbi:hypothetical protein L0Y49_00655 [bacterium]|nr:hypothetical protein [bacterium]MCI0565848.1 hypothetical protein [bacterium]
MADGPLKEFKNKNTTREILCLCDRSVDVTAHDYVAVMDGEERFLTVMEDGRLAWKRPNGSISGGFFHTEEAAFRALDKKIKIHERVKKS